jgi:predicted PP-loop superfamily ATPase
LWTYNLQEVNIRCHICNVELDTNEIQLDPRDGKYLPCPTCQSVIEEAVNESEEDSSWLDELKESLDDFLGGDS